MAIEQWRFLLRLRAVLAVFFLGLSATKGSFAPEPLEHFAETDEIEGVRRFSHHEQHMLEDGSEFVLHWRVQADPDSILSLDVEHGSGEKGVKLLECRPDGLLLRVPAAHSTRIQSWKHIVASRLVHACKHLEEHPLYHRVKEVQYALHHTHGPVVVLHTQELYSASALLPHIDWTYHTRPIESMDEDEQEERRAFLAARPDHFVETSSRRLAFTNFKKFWKDSVHYKKPKVKSNFLPVKGGPAHIHDLLNFTPLRDANFGWNWDFKLEAPRSPNFKFHFPGGKGKIAFRDPYLKVHAGMMIHFTSTLDMDNLEVAPHVQVTANVLGNAQINLDFATSANVNEDVNVKDAMDQALEKTTKGLEKIQKKISEMPNSMIKTGQLQKFHIPMLKNFTQDTYYFKPIEFYVANVPVRLSPGIRIGLDAFHLGRIKGSLRAGLNTLLKLNGTVSFNSDIGIEGNFTCEAFRVKIQPPTWLIFTRHFEMGAALKPSFWLKGGIGQVKHMVIQAELIPYFNVSILQHGNQAFGPQHLVTEKQLIIYPFRLVGLAQGSEWAVRIIAHGQMKTTSIQASSGVIEFSDHVQGFHFGKIAQNDLVEAPILVQLLRDGVTAVGKPFKLFCESVLNGECHPSPSEASFEIDGKPVILQLTMAWQDEPTQFLLKKVRSFGLVFPSLNLTSSFGMQTMSKRPDKITFRFRRNGRVYDSHMELAQLNDGQAGPNSVTLDAKTIYEMGPVYVDNWHMNFGSYSNQEALIEAAKPRVQLLYKYSDGNEDLVGEGQLPGIPWDKDVRGMYGAAFEGMLPMEVNLKDKKGMVIATGVAGIQVQSPMKAAYWIRPATALKFPQGTKQELHWTIDVPEKTPVDFEFSTFKVLDNGDYVQTPMVHEMNQQECVQNEAMARRYGDYGTPCVFSEMLNVQNGLVGSRMAFQMTWTADDIHHKVLSAPASFVTATVRRLYEEPPAKESPRDDTVAEEEEDDEDDEQVLPSLVDLAGKDVEVPMRMLLQQVPAQDEQVSSEARRLPAAGNGLDAQMAQRQECDRQPLEYSLGIGIYFRATVHNLHLPGFGTGIDLPNWDSELIPIHSWHFGKKLSDSVPKALCDRGICDGTLPGCSPKKVEATIIPKVEFQLSRAFNWSPETSNFTRATIAYGMAMAPGLLELAAVSFKKLLQSTSTTTLTMTEADMYFKGEGDDKGKICTWVPREECVSAFQYEGSTYFGCTKSGSRSGWCSLDYSYVGNWKACRSECKERWGAVQTVPDRSSASFKRSQGTSPTSQNCFWTRAPLCVGEFTYKAYNYFGCVTNPNDANQAWCSEDSEFSGRWHKCHWRCPDELGPVSPTPLHTPSSSMRGQIADGNPPIPFAGHSPTPSSPLPSQDQIDTNGDSHGTTTQRPHAKRSYVSTTQRPHATRSHVSTTQRPHAERSYVSTTQRPHATRSYVSTTQRPHATRSYVSTTRRHYQTTEKPRLSSTPPMPTSPHALDKTTQSTTPFRMPTMPPDVSTTSKVPEPGTTGSPPSTGWQCHHSDLAVKNDRQWDQWCKTNPIENGTQYRWFGEEGQSPCAGCWCCQRPQARRLETPVQDTDGPGETESFFVHFDPDAVIYNINKPLVHQLIKRGAFQGLWDGRERDLGEAQIIGFKIHHPNGEIEADDMKEADPAVHDPPSWLILPAALLVVSLLSVAVLFAVRALKKSRVHYEEVGGESDSAAA